jgi:Ca2+-binding EF-hand superfamily protein
MLLSNRIHDTYTKALASDAINELHPETLQFMQDSSEESMQQAKDLMLLKLGFNADAPGISVSDLRKRFERGTISTPPSQPRVRRSSLGVTSPLFDGNVMGGHDQLESTSSKSQMFADDSSSDKARSASSSNRRSSQVAQLQQMFGGAGRIQIPKRMSATRRASLGSVNTVREMQIASNRKSLKASSLAEAAASLSPSSVSTSTTTTETKESSVVSASATSSARNTTMSKIFGSTFDEDQSFETAATSSSSSQLSAAKPSGAEAKSVRFASFSASESKTADSDGSSATNVISPSTPEAQFTSEGNTEEGENQPKSEVENVLFTQTEILALRLMFSLYDRSGSDTIEYEDLVAYAEETGDTAGIRDAGIALNIIDIDGDGKIGLLDFFHFAARLKAVHDKKDLNSLT